MNKTPVLLAMAALLTSGLATAVAQTPNPDTARRLQEARARLDAAAREVAELSMQQGGADGAPHVFTYRLDGGRRAILGVQLGQGGSGDSSKGAKLLAVSPGGPAAAAGLKAGDWVVGIQGTDLRTKDNAERELMEQMKSVKPDQKVKLKVQRDGKALDFEVTARAAPQGTLFPGGTMMGPGAALNMGPRGLMEMDGEGLPGVVGALLGRRGMFGLELATLTSKLGQYFGVDKGVLVLKAPEANKLQLEEGDVIVAIDGREPTNSSHALRILQSYQPGEKVKLRVQRQRRALTLEGEIAPQRERSFSDGPPPAGMFEMPVPPPAPVPGAAPRIERQVVIRTQELERT